MERARWYERGFQNTLKWFKKYLLTFSGNYFIGKKRADYKNCIES